jgi:hypothetical protein
MIRALNKNVILGARLATFKGNLLPVRTLIPAPKSSDPVMLKSGSVTWSQE